jgi:hypothetical protein
VREYEVRKEKVMKAREFITEKMMPNRYAAPLSKAKRYPEYPSSSPYRIYRFSTQMADHTTDQTYGAAANLGVTVAYTDGDEEIIQATEKRLGTPSERLSTDASEEMDNINNQSPVAKKKKNKYGV